MDPLLAVVWSVRKGGCVALTRPSSDEVWTFVRVLRDAAAHVSIAVRPTR